MGLIPSARRSACRTLRAGSGRSPRWLSVFFSVSLCVLCGCLPWAGGRRVSVRRAANRRRAFRMSASRRTARASGVDGGSRRRGTTIGSDTGPGAPRRGIWRTRPTRICVDGQAVHLLDRPHRRAVLRGQLAQRLPGPHDVRHRVDRRRHDARLDQQRVRPPPQFLRHRVVEPHVIVRAVPDHVLDDRRRTSPARSGRCGPATPCPRRGQARSGRATAGCACRAGSSRRRCASPAREPAPSSAPDRG